MKVACGRGRLRWSRAAHSLPGQAGCLAKSEGGDPAPYRSRQLVCAMFTTGSYTGTGVWSTASWTISAGVRPADRASGARMSRCASTGTATAFTSSGRT